MRVKQVNYRGVNLTIVVKRVKGKLYVYDEFRDKATGKVKTYYIGPLEEMVRVYQIVKQGNYVKLTRRELTTLARKIVEYYVKKHAVVNSGEKWRRGRDLNPRGGVPHRLSRPAPYRARRPRLR